MNNVVLCPNSTLMTQIKQIFTDLFVTISFSK